jgi:hypothetical protein
MKVIDQMKVILSKTIMIGALGGLLVGCESSRVPTAADGGARDASTDVASDAAGDVTVGDAVTPRTDSRQPADGRSDGQGDGGSPDSAALPDIAPIGDAMVRLDPLKNVAEGHFATSLRCADCHANATNAEAMRDEKKRPIAPFDLWRASPMANASRDPIWRAVVSAEVAALPALRGAIEERCMNCHAPMAYTQAIKNKEPPVSMALITGSDNRSQLALDGVSCTLCHQIKPDQLGTAASFSGHFAINDQKQIYGPHQNLFTTPMANQTGGFTPTPAAHMGKSSLCGSCHTLFVDTFDKNGQSTGVSFAEQTPYLEWRNSVYSTESATPAAQAKDCQDCHMPKQSADGVAISTAVARRPDGSDFPAQRVPSRSSYGRHLFVGGNTLLAKLLTRFADELAPNASKAAFDAYIGEVRTLLSKQTATVSIANVKKSGNRVDAAITIKSLVGHKLPTAYPSRRVVLSVRVIDASGRPVWASGRFNSYGQLLRADGSIQPFEKRAGGVSPHHDLVDDQNKVQIYEGVMGLKNGDPTYHLLFATQYIKDNRLLPAGFKNSYADFKHVAPVGTSSDASFVGGGDTIGYRIELPASAKAPLRIEAELAYQTMSPRFADELFVAQTNEVQALRRMISQVGLAPESIASQSATIPN